MGLCEQFIQFLSFGSTIEDAFGLLYLFTLIPSISAGIITYKITESEINGVLAWLIVQMIETIIFVLIIAMVNIGCSVLPTVELP